MANADLDRLCSRCVEFAQKMPARHGELVPFAFALRRGGAIVPVILKNSDPNAGNAIMQQLTAGLQTLANQQQVN